MIKEEKKQYKSDISAMWQRNFHDPAPYTEFYFDEVYPNNTVLINESGEGDLMGMLHLNPYQLRAGGIDIPVHYIVGVATDEEYRRQGVMRELLIYTFEELRAQGELLTYLMPADDAYYLPFDFRFGSEWVELELEYQTPPVEDSGNVYNESVGDDSEKRFSQKAGDRETYLITDRLSDSEQAEAVENALRDSSYFLHTKISSEYLERLDKESRSDFAKLFYVYLGEKYIGRFVAGAQHDFMILSQISCCLKEKVGFIKQILDFCENRYHYGKYQIILDETWMVESDSFHIPGSRVFSIKKKPMIMFRMLDLEKAGRLLRVSRPGKCRFQVEDRLLKELNGTYFFDCSPEKCKIKKYEKNTDPITVQEEFDGAPEGGILSIGDLTSILFGKISSKDIDKLPQLTDDGKKLLKQLIPWQKNCIMEYV